MRKRNSALRKRRPEAIIGSFANWDSNTVL
jgi:hypothetical protein